MKIEEIKLLKAERQWNLDVLKQITDELLAFNNQPIMGLMPKNQLVKLKKIITDLVDLELKLKFPRSIDLEGK
jgi:hypothetical protein